jgi:hypothetical protein
MPIILPQVNLSQTVVTIGSTGIIDLSNIGIGTGTSANPSRTLDNGTLYLFNESGCGLQISSPENAYGFFLPPGAWYPARVPIGATKFNWQVVTKLPNPQLNSLIPVYYFPGEDVPNMILGNSPIGVGGQVSQFGLYGSQMAASPGTGTFTISFPNAPIGQQNYLVGFIFTGQQSFMANVYQLTIDIDHITMTPTAPRMYTTQNTLGVNNGAGLAFTFPYLIPQDTSGNNISIIFSGWSELCSAAVFGANQ